MLLGAMLLIPVPAIGQQFGFPGPPPPLPPHVQMCQGKRGVAADLILARRAGFTEEDLDTSVRHTFMLMKYLSATGRHPEPVQGYEKMEAEAAELVDNIMLIEPEALHDDGFIQGWMGKLMRECIEENAPAKGQAV